MYWVYIIESERDGKYYTGQTDSLGERIARHNMGRNLSTKAYVPWKLKWYKEFETRSEAVKIEKKIKAIKKRDGIEKFIIKNGFQAQ